MKMDARNRIRNFLSFLNWNYKECVCIWLIVQQGSFNDWNSWQWTIYRNKRLKFYEIFFSFSLSKIPLFSVNFALKTNKQHFSVFFVCFVHQKDVFFSSSQKYVIIYHFRYCFAMLNNAMNSAHFSCIFLYFRLRCRFMWQLSDICTASTSGLNTYFIFFCATTNSTNFIYFSSQSKTTLILFPTFKSTTFIFIFFCFTRCVA